MSEVVIKVENLSKQYRLGMVGTGTITDDLKRWWAIVRGKEDPFINVGDVNNRAVKGTSDYVWALRNIDFEVKRGEVLGIIGKNGAGKSTLLKILSKITTPTTGSIKIKGRVASLLEVGTGFHPELSGRENIFQNGAILGMRKSEIKSKFDEIVEFSGVAKYIDTPVKRYSSGMYVRLAFAVAAHLEPEILIVDEVLAVGDAEFQEKCLGKMKEVSGQGRTVLFVSHNMGAVKGLCGRGLLLENGEIKILENDVDNVIRGYFKKEKEAAGHFSSGKFAGWEKVILKNAVISNQHNIVTEVYNIGDDLTIDMTIFAEEEIERPHIGIAISWQYGTLSGADTMYDGSRTSTLKKGDNKIKITFSKLPLLPNEYYIRIAIRAQDGKISLMESKTIAYFSIRTRMKELGVEGSLAEEIAEQAISPFIPYKWDFGNGNVYSFNIVDRVK